MMLTRSTLTQLTITLFSILAIALAGCSGGGGGGDDSRGSSDSPTPSLEVSPTEFTFDTVTDGNTVEPLEVTLRNNGSADLVVSDIALTGTDEGQFELYVDEGTDPCGSTSPTLAESESCNVTVYFDPDSSGTFDDAALTITSNDADSPYVLPLEGTKEDINDIEVKINQIDACSHPSMTVYVSVTDQSGFAVQDLEASDFSLSEDGGAESAPTASDYVPTDGSASISIALLMDYSGSITRDEDNVTDMENAAKNFVSQLGTGDQAEIIKYAGNIQVMTQGFTSDIDDLEAAIEGTPSEDFEAGTALYDAIVQAVEDISETDTIRRAIIVITDGRDLDGDGNQLSENDKIDVINEATANGTPVFTVGLGEDDYLDEEGLMEIADDTGGTYSDSTTSSNLSNIYQQLANLLFDNQYVLTYSSSIAADTTGTLEVTATYSGTISDSDSMEFTAGSCP